jgi:hypothetical protein
MNSWEESLLIFIVGVLLIIGMIWGMKAILVIAPLVIVIAYIYWRISSGCSIINLLRDWDNAKVIVGLICGIIVILFIGSCINGCFERNPDTPKDLELKYKIWKSNNHD